MIWLPVRFYKGAVVSEEWWGPEYKCDKCGSTMIGKSNFCPNCGEPSENPDPNECV
jgi:rubrerythrin